MRYLVMALAALVLGVTVGSPAPAQDKEKNGPKVELKSGREVKGKLIKVEVERKQLVVRTSLFGTRQIPVKGKLELQKGKKGRPHPETLEAARRLVGQEVVVIHRPDSILIIDLK